MKYAVWLTHLDGRQDEHSPRTVVAAMPLQFGDKLPLANVDAWIAEIIDGEWTSESGEVFEGRAAAAAGPSADDRSIE